ncbi:hypothetical protein GE21DRAFT_1062441 [Neurospora crassa]|nr:hypothetical protein GE21DRAFT_1062441 [Neurospora crassa]
MKRGGNEAALASSLMALLHFYTHRGSAAVHMYHALFLLTSSMVSKTFPHWLGQREANQRISIDLIESNSNNLYSVSDDQISQASN